MKKSLWNLSFILVLPMIMSCSQFKEEVDLLVFNTQIYTVDSAFSIAESFAVKDGKFYDIGTNQEILSKYRAANNFNAIGQTIYPGFIDGHCHFYGYSLGLQQNANLRGTKSQEEIIEILKVFRKDHPYEWLTGRSWDQNDWEIKEFPSKEILDAAFPDIPVYLTRVDGHAAWVNSKAIELANINSNIKVDGGNIIKRNGEVTGVLIDNAMGLVRSIIPAENEEMSRNALLEGQEKCFAVGLTSVVDAGVDYNIILMMDEMHKSGDFKMRINTMLNPTQENFDGFVKNGPFVTEKLSVRSIKVYADGALGSRGALMLEPYSDDPLNKGLLIEPLDYYREICELAYNNNYQMCIHAIGDKANRMSLEIFGEYLKEKNDRRWRIEHSQIIHPDDFKLFEKYSIIPSIQQTHATSDMYWAEDRVGAERIKGAYAYNNLLKTNGWLIAGTDFPVEKIDPLLTFYASVSRKDADGWPTNGFQMTNALSREETLRSMTIWAAKGSFEENVKGSIEIGKYADFVILDKDILKADEREILNTNIVATYVGGELVYNTEKIYDK